VPRYSICRCFTELKTKLMNTTDEENEEGKEGLCYMDFVLPVLRLDLLPTVTIGFICSESYYYYKQSKYVGSCYKEIRF